ncbi:MAG: endonuclease III domain-containing protein [Phycisphaerae bacterium]|nr:endonuclease III domain-containing protein [Phycisphaerae bacterium]NUQ46697.1 endonuclease III domain-containing protein [Phycisphaerae bacterium]
MTRRTRTDADARDPLPRMFDALLTAWGPQHWWPGQTPLEVIVGAILTQNTNWKNVERAIARLREHGMLDWQELHVATAEELAELIRTAGTYRVKARRLKAFVEFLFARHGGRLENMKRVATAELRRQLLAVPGIGPETADAILLYALGRPVFVVDAYTRRVLLRHRLIDERASYEDIQRLFESVLPRDTAMFNEYHALLVEVGKRHCRPSARCAGCPLDGFPHDEEA